MPTLPPARRALLRRRLVAWYRRAHRDLPWRRTRDPYRIWLSEAMLQQTRVDTVLPYYERFLERFPDVQALADADEQDVLAAWSGLGYYSRARNLKRAAERVVAEHGGALPRDVEALAQLPGIGRYTAGAISSIAFRRPAPLVDGNVARVLSRLLGWTRPSAADLWGLAGELVTAERPDLFNQALMELGALVCTPRTPDCAGCPVRATCEAQASGRPEAFPAPAPRRAPRAIAATAGLLERGGRRPALLLVRRPANGLLGGLWELPSVEGGSRRELVEEVRRRTGIRTRALAQLAEVRHAFTHRALWLRVVRLEREAGRLRGSDDVRWCSPAELERLPLSSLARKTLTLARTRPVPSRDHPLC